MKSKRPLECLLGDMYALFVSEKTRHGEQSIAQGAEGLGTARRYVRKHIGVNISVYVAFIKLAKY